jgi:ABC-type antimicrobial peptide transport system permease subunit
MNIKEYNAIFGTDYTAESALNFVPHKIKLTQYAYADVDKKNPLFETEVTITHLHDRAWYLASDIAALFADAQVYNNALYFDGTDGIGAVLDTAEKLNYQPQSFAVEGIHTMTKAVDVFIPIFELIAVILCVGVVFILMNFSSKMIKDKMHEIGILKALGAKNPTIGTVFGLQVLLIALLTCVLSTVGYYFFIDMANEVLIESLKRLAPTSVVLDLDFLTFRPKIAMINCVLVAVLALVSLIFPMLRIKAIKPVKIIKAKE